MEHSKKGERGKQKILDRSRHMLNAREAPEKYTQINKFIATFETTYFKVNGIKVHIVYKGGYYYFDHVRWNHQRLEKELNKLLIQEQKLNLLSDLVGDFDAH